MDATGFWNPKDFSYSGRWRITAGSPQPVLGGATDSLAADTTGPASAVRHVAFGMETPPASTTISSRPLCRGDWRVVSKVYHNFGNLRMCVRTVTRLFGVLTCRYLSAGPGLSGP